jgi:hypothetical protein
MLLLVENNLRSHEIPAIWESDEEKVLSDWDLKTACFYFARQHFQGKTFRNKSINNDITVSREGLGEWKTKTKSRDQILSIKILDKLLVHSIYWKEKNDGNEDPNIDKIRYYYQQCRINGTFYRAVLTIKVYKYGQYSKYYHHFLDDAAPKK